MDMETKIRTRYKNISDQVQETAVKANRDPNLVKLLVVTKGHTQQDIETVIDAGARYIGENYPDETQKKVFAIDPDKKKLTEWHMIGHLQSRKSQIAIEIFDCIQSVDRIKIAEKLNSKLQETGQILPILLQYNIGGESQKFGWNADIKEDWAGLLADFEKIRLMPNLRIHGLMTMPPYTEDKKLARHYFSKLRGLRDYFQNNFPDERLNELSMGTSHDFEDAIFEGATIIRVGTAIMGERNYH